MSEFNYQIVVEIDLGIVPEAKAVFDEVNKHMAEFGFSEKVGATSRAPLWTLAVSKPLTEEQKNQVIAIFNYELADNPVLNKIRAVEIKEA